MVADTSGLEATLRARAASLADIAADIVVTMCKQDCPVSAPSPTNDHSGRLRDDLRVLDTFSDGVVETRAVGSDLVYASFTDEEDTAAHLIDAVNARHLRFYWDRGPSGAHIYFFRQVLHPGTHGQHWFTSQNPARWDSALQSAAAA